MTEMKDSGVQWIGEIPKTWTVERTKYNFKNKKNIVGPNAKNYERLALTMKGVVKRPKDDSTGLQPENFESYQILKAKELVFKLIDLQNISTSRVGLSAYTGIVSPAYIIISAEGKILPQYAEKWFLSLWYNQVFNHIADDGVRSNIGAYDLMNIPIAFPTIPEQKTISDYLDCKLTEIDTLAADIEKQIETLEQYKRSLITEAVTKGLNPNVKMKDSGIDWIGEVPKNWAFTKISALYSLRTEKVSDKDYPPLSVTMKGILPQLDTAAKTDDGDNRKLVKKGDFVINSRSDRRGSCGISEYDGSVSLINTVLSPRKNMCPKYYDWLFHCTMFSDEFYRWGHGIVDDLWTTNWQNMKKIIIPVPSLPEQQAIANYLDDKCIEIDSIIADKKTQLDTLTSYKKSLIYEYVTGKKEVPV